MENLSLYNKNFVHYKTIRHFQGNFSLFLHLEGNKTENVLRKERTGTGL